ncbi:hypothetical protein IV102_37780 [bacterium]|nr:hypothetical protein [bacterium]
MALQRFIEGREVELCARDKSRVGVPFEWGLEHLGLSADSNPRAALLDYSRRMLKNSDAFFSCPSAPLDQFDFDGHVLRFPSALRTPYPENNLVWGRLFPSRSSQRKGMAVIVLPQFNSQWESQVGLCRLLQWAGLTSLRLSPPYHHQRKPAYLLRPEYMVSANIGRTIAATRQGVMDVRRAVDWLLAQGYPSVALVGTCIGALLGFLTAAHDPRLSKCGFIHISSLYADVVWRGLSTTHVRAVLQHQVTLTELRNFWAPISPLSFVPRLQGQRRPMLMFSGKYDPTCLPELSQDLYREFDRQAIPYRSAWLPCGHYTMGVWPFTWVVAARLVAFLRLGWA